MKCIFVSLSNNDKARKGNSKTDEKGRNKSIYADAIVGCRKSERIPRKPRLTSLVRIQAKYLESLLNLWSSNEQLRSEKHLYAVYNMKKEKALVSPSTCRIFVLKLKR